MQIQRIYRCEQKGDRLLTPDVRLTGSPRVHEGLSVCPLWGSFRGSCGGGGRRAGIRVIPSESKELKVPVQFVVESIVGVGGF